MSEDVSPYCSAHDELLIIKLCMYVGYHDANNVSTVGGDPVTQLYGQYKLFLNNTVKNPLILPPSESHWCGRIRGMVAREGFVYEQKPLSVTRNVVV